MPVRRGGLGEEIMGASQSMPAMDGRFGERRASPSAQELLCSVGGVERTEQAHDGRLCASSVDAYGAGIEGGTRGEKGARGNVCAELGYDGSSCGNSQLDESLTPRSHDLGSHNSTSRAFPAQVVSKAMPQDNKERQEQVYTQNPNHSTFAPEVCLQKPSLSLPPRFCTPNHKHYPLSPEVCPPNSHTSNPLGDSTHNTISSSTHLEVYNQKSSLPLSLKPYPQHSPSVLVDKNFLPPSPYFFSEDKNIGDFINPRFIHTKRLYCLLQQTRKLPIITKLLERHAIDFDNHRIIMSDMQTNVEAEAMAEAEGSPMTQAVSRKRASSVPASCRYLLAVPVVLPVTVPAALPVAAPVAVPATAGRPAKKIAIEKLSGMDVAGDNPGQDDNVDDYVDDGDEDDDEQDPVPLDRKRKRPATATGSATAPGGDAVDQTTEPEQPKCKKGGPRFRKLVISSNDRKKEEKPGTTADRFNTKARKIKMQAIKEAVKASTTPAQQAQIAELATTKYISLMTADMHDDRNTQGMKEYWNETATHPDFALCKTSHNTIRQNHQHTDNPRNISPSPAYSHAESYQAHESLAQTEPTECIFDGWKWSYGIWSLVNSHAADIGNGNEMIKKYLTGPFATRETANAKLHELTNYDQFDGGLAAVARRHAYEQPGSKLLKVELTLATGEDRVLWVERRLVNVQTDFTKRERRLKKWSAERPKLPHYIVECEFVIHGTGGTPQKVPSSPIHCDAAIADEVIGTHNGEIELNRLPLITFTDRGLANEHAGELFLRHSAVNEAIRKPLDDFWWANNAVTLHTEIQKTIREPGRLYTVELYTGDMNVRLGFDLIRVAVHAVDDVTGPLNI
ncbi:uncharacterized protein F4822DRAFT_439625 [Hypoxylon trugodes]|uniref:uncharacterized protein n=1 Tax=Hypoxylon trugodes TaxID=326681 RepID=UPI00219704C8|nr:uncharacterized protein F4822DRAFT_439625 [Hypoxylon trugodes]KAI1393604.1 hypothetical protein F4822DRAFT_439625 [Hypoxylon trugodes]